MQESGEMYLETILLLGRASDKVRAVDIANKLGYSRASVSRAIANLVESKYVSVLENGDIILTRKGARKASSIYNKHCLIAKYLQQTLGLNSAEAEKNACKIEHVVTEKCFKHIKNYLRFNKR
jgi:Mn-dependent DtxR family transcriptional regulator